MEVIALILFFGAIIGGFLIAKPFVDQAVRNAAVRKRERQIELGYLDAKLNAEALDNVRRRHV